MTIEAFANDLSRVGLGPDGPGFWLLIAALLMLTLLWLQISKLTKRVQRLRAALQDTKVSLASAQARGDEAEHLRSALQAAGDERTRLESAAAAGAARLAEREKALAELKARMDTDFQAAASAMLDNAHKAFLQRADETFKRHRDASSADAELRRKSIHDLVGPMRETLSRYEKGLSEMRLEQQKARGELTSRIGDLARSANDVRLEAQKLSTALRAGPKVRGRWGEEQLRNVVEMAGMASYVDFREQASHHDGDQRKQPDMVVLLPGERVLAVDSKVSLGAYLDALEAEDETLRTAHLDKHANDLWMHVKSLSSKEYAASLRDSLDFVVMFVPGENYFTAAVEARPTLFQEAFDRKVLIATPTTLVAILKSAAYGWRQEKSVENARAVAGMAKELYDSLKRMGVNLAGLGKSLEGAVKKYNELVGGIESRVMPRARKFAEYELPGVEEVIEAGKTVENLPRKPRSDRDLLLPPTAEDDQSAA